MARILTFNHKIINPGNNRYLGSFGSGPTPPTPPDPPEPTVYDVILTTGGHGSITADPMSGAKDTLITLSNTPDQNYVFSKYTLNNVDLAGNTFLMPEADANVKGWFEADVRTITVTQPSHGTITAPASAQVGSTVTLSITTDTGYALQYFTVNGTQIQGNTFVMPASNVTVGASLAADPTIEYNLSKVVPTGVSGISVKNTDGYQITKAHAGDTINLTYYTLEPLYVFRYYTVNGQQINGSSFTMPAEDVTVSALVEKDTSSIETVTIGGIKWTKNNIDYKYTRKVGSACYYSYDDAVAVANYTPGFHLPTEAEVNALLAAAGNDSESRFYGLASTTGWNLNNGNNTTGMNLKPEGFLRVYNNQQGDLGDSSNIWIQNSGKNRYLCAASKSQQGTYAEIISGSGGFNDSYRIQVRLVKDS